MFLHNNLMNDIIVYHMIVKRLMFSLQQSTSLLIISLHVHVHGSHIVLKMLIKPSVS